MVKYLIVPDVHCHELWKTPVKNILENTDGKVIFLGDYLDGYPDEWEYGVDYEVKGVQNLREIIKTKKDYPERVILLQGNHDSTYTIGESVCCCRTDYLHKSEITKIFEDNWGDFKIAHEDIINNKHFIFSHAGLLKGYFKEQFPNINFEKINPVEFLNNAWLVKDYSVLYALGVYDYYRGYGGVKYASPVWSDVRSWIDLKEEDSFGFNVVGHTRVMRPIMLETIACLDCQQCFYIDENGDIFTYGTDIKLEKQKQQQ